MVLRDPALRIPVNRLLQEHRVIAFAAGSLLTRLDDAANGGFALRADLEAAAAAAVVPKEDARTAQALRVARGLGL